MLEAKHKIHMGCWNVRTLFIVGKASQVGREMRQYGIEILGVGECRWNGYGSNKLRRNYHVFRTKRRDRTQRRSSIYFIRQSN
jgi:hypothetical protein